MSIDSDLRGIRNCSCSKKTSLFRNAVVIVAYVSPFRFFGEICLLCALVEGLSLCTLVSICIDSYLYFVCVCVCVCERACRQAKLLRKEQKAKQGEAYF